MTAGSDMYGGVKLFGRLVAFTGMLRMAHGFSGDLPLLDLAALYLVG